VPYKLKTNKFASLLQFSPSKRLAIMRWCNYFVNCTKIALNSFSPKCTDCRSAAGSRQDRLGDLKRSRTILSAAELLRFQCLTLWSLACFKCCAPLWDNFHQVWPSTTWSFSGVRGPNVTKLGQDIGRSSQHCSIVSEFGYLAAFQMRVAQIEWCCKQRQISHFFPCEN